MSESLAIIPFDELVPGATARMGMIGNVQHLSIRDILMHICELSTVTANQKWRLLPDEVKAEVAQFLGNLKFPGKGNKMEPVITFKGALKLVMLVSGQKAALYRSSMVKILQRYYAGDDSLEDEIQANAKSSSPIAQMARASLAAEQVEDRSLVELKRKREELENSKLEMDIESKRIANCAAEAEIELKKQAAEAEIELKKRAAEVEIELKKHAAEAEIKLKSRATEAEIESVSRANRAADLANKAAEHGLIAKVSNSYHELCQNMVMDERARLIFKDSFLNMAMLQGPSSSNGEQANKPVSLSTIATELGMKFSTDELKSIGILLSKRYFAKHGKAPTKHEQLVNGMMLKINSYTESDRPLIEEVLREFRDAKK